jgi:hypothetical protein
MHELFLSRRVDSLEARRCPITVSVNSEAQADEDKKFRIGMEVLYEDKYCKLTHSELSIKWYYFPFGTKTLSYSEIKSYGRALQYDLDIMSIKAWGMALAPIWWALGPMKRISNLSNEIIVQVRGSSIKCGFSSMDPAAVLRVLNTKVVTLPGLIRVDTAPLK